MRSFFFLLFIANIISAQVTDSLTITYIANAGFLFSHKDKKILIDAVFNEGYNNFAVPSDSLLSKIISGTNPFDKIDLTLVTHKHNDHFNASLLSDFLKNHTRTPLVSSDEVCSQLSYDTGLIKQVNSFTLNLGETIDTIINEIPLRIFRLKHNTDQTGNTVINFAYLINIDGIKIFHPGDYRIGFDSTALDKFNLGDENINVMFLSYADISGTAVRHINEIIKPGNVVGMHIPPKEYENGSVKFLNAYTGAIVMKNEMDTRNILIDNPTGIERKGLLLLAEFSLKQNYPNPFNPSTIIYYTINKNLFVSLKVYNVLGQEIKSLVGSYQNTGEYSITWNGTDINNNPVSSGVYFYRLEAGGNNMQKKMVLIK